MYASPDLADAFAIDLPPGTSTSPEALARFLFLHRPLWVGLLMGVRDAVVGRLGLKTASALKPPGAGGARIGIFRLYEANTVEVVVGEDDRHLDFRASAMVQPGLQGGAGARLVLTTVVHCHNRLGRGYIAVIAPFHRLVVQAYLRRAARAGWPVGG